MNYLTFLRQEKSLDKTKSINSKSNYKSSGSDTFTVKFYKHFPNQLGPVLLNVYDSYEKLGTFGVTFKTGIISVIYKKGNKTILKTTDPYTTILRIPCKKH